MKQTIQQTRKLIYRIFSIALAASLLFVTLIFSPQAIETDFRPHWAWDADEHDGLVHLAFFPESFSGISATGMRLLRAGMTLPDGRRVNAAGNLLFSVHPTIRCACLSTGHNINLRGRRFRTFHGYHTHSSTNDLSVNNMFNRNNYISSFTLITLIANAGGVVPANTTPATVGLTQQAFDSITSRFVVANGVPTGMICGTCEQFRSWNDIMEINGHGAAYRAQDAQGQRSFRRHFIWGIALHALTDAFEHSVVVRVSANSTQWRLLVRRGDDSSIAETERFAAAQAAFNEALIVAARPPSHAHRHGCYRVFLAAGSLINGNSFRLANLLDYAMENRTALISAGLNPA